MKMSVYRQRAPVVQMDHGACIEGATTDEDVQLIEMALTTEKPVLIGLDGQNTILKTAVEGDEVHSFEGFYDTCITLGDLRKARSRGVKTPAEIPHEKYDCQILAIIHHAELDLNVRLTAASGGDLRKVLRDLLNNDAEFRDQMSDQIAKALRRQDADLIIRLRGNQATEEAHVPGTPLWEFP